MPGKNKDIETILELQRLFNQKEDPFAIPQNVVDMAAQHEADASNPLSKLGPPLPPPPIPEKTLLGPPPPPPPIPEKTLPPRPRPGGTTPGLQPWAPEWMHRTNESARSALNYLAGLLPSLPSPPTPSLLGRALGSGGPSLKSRVDAAQEMTERRKTHGFEEDRRQRDVARQIARSWSPKRSEERTTRGHEWAGDEHRFVKTKDEIQAAKEAAKEAEAQARAIKTWKAKEKEEAAEIERLAVEARAQEEADRKAKEAAFREQILGRRKSMEDERNRRERAKRLAEALGGITRFGPISSAQILLGQEAKPFKSKAHDRRLAELDRDLDPIYDPDSLQSIQDRKFFSDTFGVEVGEGASSASLRQAFPAFRDTMGQRFSADQQEKREASAGKRQKQRFTHEEKMAKESLKRTALTTLSKQKAAQAKERKAHEKVIRDRLEKVRDRVDKDPSYRRSVEAINDARMVLEQLKSKQGDGDKAALRVLKDMWDKSDRGGMYQSKLAAAQPQIFDNFGNWWSNISRGTISEKKREQMVEAATTFSDEARKIKQRHEDNEIYRETNLPESPFYRKEDVLESYFADPGEDRAHEKIRALFQGGTFEVLEASEQE